MFASHPLMKDRLANIAKVVREEKLAASASVAPRYAKHVTFDVKPLGRDPCDRGDARPDG